MKNVRGKFNNVLVTFQCNFRNQFNRSNDTSKKCMYFNCYVDCQNTITTFEVFHKCVDTFSPDLGHNMFIFNVKRIPIIFFNYKCTQSPRNSCRKRYRSLRFWMQAWHDLKRVDQTLVSQSSPHDTNWGQWNTHDHRSRLIWHLKLKEISRNTHSRWCHDQLIIYWWYVWEIRAGYQEILNKTWIFLKKSQIK